MTSETAGWRLDADYPGGNILLESVDGDEVRLRQDLRDSPGGWFYWSFRVRGAAGRRLRFTFTGSPVLGVRGPAVSLDRGVTWRWLGAEAVEGASFSYRFGSAPETRFGFAMNYTQRDLYRFLRPTGLKAGVLCRSRAGREVELLRVEGRPGAPKVLITCRHHCCEMMASYAVEGLLRAAMDGALRGAGLVVVPFADKDGVEAGDQGKNRTPHDHNRDYETGLYPETRAIRELVAADPGIVALLDLHCPHVRGNRNENIYQVGSADEDNWRAQQQFGACLEAAATGRLPYRAADDLPYGMDWNCERNYGSGVSCGRWASVHPQLRLGSSIEIPYANAGGEEVNQSTARGFGADLAAGLAAWLEG